MSQTQPAEDQDELDAVLIKDNGEPLVDFLASCDSEKLIFSPTHPVFDFPRVHLLRASVARMICEAAQQLPDGMRLQIVEGYRPIAVQRAMYWHALDQARQAMPDADDKAIAAHAGRYSAPPNAKTPPPHLTGGAVDLEIVGEDGVRLDFTSPFDLQNNAGTAFDAPGISETARSNRDLLKSILEPTGLTNYADEWWHWSYGDNGWALRVGADGAIYDTIEMPADAHWVGELDKMPVEAQQEMGK